MLCIKCSGKTVVLESRDRDVFFYRRRKCCECNFRFSTSENVMEREQKAEPPKVKKPPVLKQKPVVQVKATKKATYWDEVDVEPVGDLGIDTSWNKDWD